MASIIRGTTPTIQFTFNEISIADLSKAYLTIKQGSDVIIERDLSSATVGENLSWTLTQTETLSLASKKDIAITCDWLLNTGVRGRSNVLKATVGEPGKDEEI